jgi:hypothetical protein
MRKAHRSGEFLVLDADLTNCLGYGDLVVVPYGRSWSKPLAVEVKTAGSMERPDEIRTTCVVATPAEQTDLELVEAFTRAVGATAQKSELDERGLKQASDLGERAALLHSVISRPTRSLRVSSRSLWPVVRNVLAKAALSGSAADVAEQGVLILAAQGNSPKALDRRLSELAVRLTDTGLLRPGMQSVLGSDAFVGADGVSASALPIALWPLAQATRFAILSGRMRMICVWDVDLWERAFASEGIELQKADTHWTLRMTGHEPGMLDQVEIEKLTTGVALSGISPRATAREISQSILSDAGD